MPWHQRDLMSLRREFVELALPEGVNRRELFRRFGISPRTGYKWIDRFKQQGVAGLHEQSRRPQSTPAQTPEPTEARVIALRRTHPAWGGRKIARRLAELGAANVPAPSTITDILRRHGLIDSAASEAATPWHRFEHEHPNSLWQIDFKGYFDTGAGPCHPLTLIDDHSRFNLLLEACSRPDTVAVQPLLTGVFRRHGLPVRINADNGSPWGSPRQHSHGLSILSVWLIRLGIRVSHSRPYHPQTNGKIERFHRSLKAEVLAGRRFEDIGRVQQAFDPWREVYNHERPHEALGLDVPVKHYQSSPTPYPDKLPAIEYPDSDTVLTVDWNGWIKFKGNKIKVSSALHRLPIALRPDFRRDGIYNAYFCHHRFMQLDLRKLNLTT